MTVAPAVGAYAPGVAGRIGSRGRAVRLSVVAAGLVLLLLGTLWGEDADFPFGPFRMYATASRHDGVVRVAALRAEWSDGTSTPVQPEQVGLRRAEFEGQLPRFRRHPELLGTIAHRFTRPGVELEALVLEQRGRRVVDGVVQPGREITDEARWEAP